jgi:hypothetical protein
MTGKIGQILSNTLRRDCNANSLFRYPNSKSLLPYRHRRPEVFSMLAGRSVTAFSKPSIHNSALSRSGRSISVRATLL